MSDSSTTLPAPAVVPRPQGRTLSALLRDITSDTRRDRISISDLISHAGDRAFGALMFIFAIPNVLPIPIPGISAILGLPLLYLTGQLMLGHSKPWLPRFIGDRSFLRSDFDQVMRRILPGLERAERVLHPRLGLFVSPTAERFVGGIAFLLSVLIFLPIPLGNMMPGFAVSFFALGILARDGLAVILGFVTAVVSVIVVSGVVYAMSIAALFVIRQAFGI